jgi:hypothetical protein
MSWFWGLMTAGCFLGMALLSRKDRKLLGLRAGASFLYLTLGYVLSVGFWAQPIVTNATINLRKASIQAST